MLFLSKEKVIEKGKKAEFSKDYILDIISKYEKNIYNDLSNNNSNLEQLRGMAILIRDIRSEVEKDINHGLSAKKSLEKK